MVGDLEMQIIFISDNIKGGLKVVVNTNLNLFKVDRQYI